MWTIVCFSVDNSVDVVPDTWYHKGTCAWPKKKGNLKKFLEGRIQPNKEDFDYYNARPLQQNIQSFHQARLKSQKAQNTSELSSNEDDKETRKKRKKIYYSSDAVNIEFSNDHTSDVLSPPTLEESEGTTIDNLLISNLQSTSNSQDMQINYESVRPNSHITKETNTLRKNLFDKFIDSEFTEVSINNNLLDSEKVLRTPTLIPQVITPTSSGDNRDDGNIAFQKSINRNIIVMKHDLKNMQESIDNLFAVQQQILDKLNNIQSETLHFDSYFDNIDDILHINNDADLDIMEDKLTKEQTFRNKVILELSRLTGSNMSETVRKIMQKLFTDNFLANYSYIGIKGKKQFSTLQTCRIIFESIRKMRQYKDISDIEIEKPLKNWMAQSSARIKKATEKCSIISDKS
uniref:DUF4806 domain-containing protein n=1 Tax=Schizaphis graminum TaxID=13262 RepID=A0A2S2NZ72_SCHGA